MLAIRLRRTGKKRQPNYRIVVADERKSVYSPYIEMLGHYDPRTKHIVLEKEKTIDWMKKGAKPSNTVAKILTKEGVEHPSIVIKKFRAISKKELEAQKAAEEAQKAKEQAEKEAAKEAFEKQVEAEKAAQPSSEEKLQAAADESIEEIKEEEAAKESTQAPKEEAKDADKTEESKEPEKAKKEE